MDDFFRRACPVGVSDAPEFLRNNLDTAVGWSGCTGVLEPDGVLVLDGNKIVSFWVNSRLVKRMDDGRAGILNHVNQEV